MVYLAREGYRIGSPRTARSRQLLDLDSVVVGALRRHKARQAQERLSAGAWIWGHGAPAPDLVFTNEIGGPLDGGRLLRAYFRPLLERAGLPSIRFHDLRHTAATLMLLAGVNAKIVE